MRHSWNQFISSTTLNAFVARREEVNSDERNMNWFHLSNFLAVPGGNAAITSFLH
jgi:hypothetical protein